jgi:hypothetical protein
MEKTSTDPADGSQPKKTKIKLRIDAVHGGAESSEMALIWNADLKK